MNCFTSEVVCQSSSWLRCKESRLMTWLGGGVGVVSLHIMEMMFGTGTQSLEDLKKTKKQNKNKQMKQLEYEEENEL